MQDAEAKVQVNLDSQKVEIDSKLSREELIAIVTDAGFPVVN